MVRVPVLSNTTVSIVRMLSRASRSFTSTPAFAARSVAIDTTRGMARPSACGQAITSTVMVRTTASSVRPMSTQTIAVMTAEPSANQNSQAAARSAMRCAREVEFCASATSLLIPARAVSSPTAVTRMRRPESVATVPATTRSLSARVTVRDSPVIIDSSMLADPETTSPSAGTRPPGRTTTRSPTCRSAGATATVASPSIRSASSGSRAARESSAEVVCARERISIQCPSSMITMSRASSHQKSSWWSRMPRLAPREAKPATVMASAMSSIIPGWRLRISLTPPTRKGLPPQTYMTVPSSGEIQATQAASGRE